MKRVTFKYVYRSTSGLDMEVTKELAKGEDKAKAIAQCIADFRNSVTPLVRIDGKLIDITAFLEEEKRSYEAASERYRVISERVGREIERRKKDPLVYP